MREMYIPLRRLRLEESQTSMGRLLTLASFTLISPWNLLSSRTASSSNDSCNGRGGGEGVKVRVALSEP